MTEKRFTLNKGLYECLDMTNCLMLPILDDGRELSVIDVLELLNELHETNEQLQHDATILIQANQDYRKENEDLKHSIKCLEADKMELQQYIKRMQGDVE